MDRSRESTSSTSSNLSRQSPVYEIKAQLAELPEPARLAIWAFYGVFTAAVIFALVGKFPLAYAYAFFLVIFWFSYSLENITEWILSRFSCALRLEKNCIIIRRRGQAQPKVFDWDELISVTLPGHGRFVTDSVILHFENEPNLRLPLIEIRNTIGEHAFLNALHMWAPHAVVHGELPGIAMKPRAISYTELWLNDLSSTNLPQLPCFLAKGAKIRGHYEVEQILGQGGQGTTYLAKDVQKDSGGQDVVLKEFIIPVTRGAALRQAAEKKLEERATLLMRLGHPQIVRMLEFFLESGRGYVALEYVSGTTLKELVAKEGAQPEHFVVKIAIQICDILSYLHGLTPQVVHRDLSPDNIMLQSDGTIKVVDFDIAQELASTRASKIAGKHRYIPVEQFRGESMPQSDLYALGCTMFFMLTGLDPEPLTVSHPQQYAGDKVSDIVESIVARSTQQDVALRFQSASDMKTRLVNAELMHG